MRRVASSILAPFVLTTAAAAAQSGPDALRPPAGVSSAVPGSSGQVVFAVRYQPVEWAGLREGTTEVAPQGLVSGPEAPYAVAPTRATMFAASAQVQWSATDRFALRGILPFQNQAMSNINSQGNSFRTFAKGVGDIELAVLMAVQRAPTHAATLQFGVGLPTGAVDLTHTFPNPDGTRPQLPYSMQPGAGVVSFRPAFTFLGRSASLTWGAHTATTLYSGTNARGWAPGDRVTVTGWVGKSLADEVALTARGEFQHWGDLRGRDSDPSLGTAIMPNGRPELQGGARLDLGAGVNWLASREHGLRFAVEYLRPMHQSLHGPQLARDWSVVFAVEVLGRQ